MIVRTDAVVLRAFDYSETSQIAALFTRQHGRISVLAKGSRRPMSRFGATLQPMAHVQVVYAHKDGRGLQTLREAAHVTRFSHLTADLGRITIGLRVVELVRALVEEGEENAPVFALVVRTLAWLDAAPDEAAANALPWFGLHLAARLGFAPDVQRDDVLALGEGDGLLMLDTGVVAPVGFAPAAGRRASRAALRAFAVFARTDLDTAGRMRLDAATRAETEALVDAFVQYHTERAFPHRVRRVADQLAHGLDG